MILPDDFITIGVVQKPRGLKGELKILPTTDHPERFSQVERLFLVSPEGERLRAFVAGVRYGQGSVFLRLKNYETPESVARFRGWEIRIPRSEALPLQEDEFYIFDLIGLDVWTTGGECIGTVADVQVFAGNQLLCVNSPEKKEYLIPFVREFVKEVLLQEGRIVIEPIEGLLD